MSQGYPCFRISKFTIHCTQGSCIIVISLMKGSEVYASRITLLLGPISSSCKQMFLMVNNESHYQLSVCLLGQMNLLVYFFWN
jgi:hypothetical protein